MIAVLGLVAAASFAVALTLGVALTPADPLTARARALAVRLQVPEAGAVAATTRAQRALAWLSERLDRAELLRSDEARAAALLLAQAGWRSGEALAVLLAVRLVLPLAIGIASWLVLRHFGSMPAVALATTALIILIASRLPTLFVRNAATRRRQRLQAALPDALDLFVICAEAGLSLDAAMHRVAREMAPGAPVIADELALTAVELGFLPRRGDALSNWAARVPLASVRGLVNILAQTERYGTPLAQSLRILAAEFRAARMLDAEAKAARLPAVLTIPMIVFVLPPLFIVLIGPAIIEVMAR